MADPEAKCLWCGKFAEYLCDAVIGQDRERYLKRAKARRSPETTHPAITCDAPMCAVHARGIGRVCGRGQGRSNSIDVCAFHSAKFGELERRFLTPEQAKQYRERMAEAVSTRVHGAEAKDFYAQLPGTAD